MRDRSRRIWDSDSIFLPLKPDVLVRQWAALHRIVGFSITEEQWRQTLIEGGENALFSSSFDGGASREAVDGMECLILSCRDRERPDTAEEAPVPTAMMAAGIPFLISHDEAHEHRFGGPGAEGLIAFDGTTARELPGRHGPPLRFAITGHLGADGRLLPDASHDPVIAFARFAEDILRGARS